ncbi:hypothetical protein ACIPSE_21335 [Streptomyces sp. NPDC090106]|uniref:hypothetical protein n=1 Tax=Streptomyces sp. NPDC090106 TaxID=3365946 RepID=UPI00380FB3AC
MRFSEWIRGRSHEDTITLALWVVMGAILAGPLFAGTVAALVPHPEPGQPSTARQLRPPLPSASGPASSAGVARPFDPRLPEPGSPTPSASASATGEPGTVDPAARAVYEEAERTLAAEAQVCGLRWELLAAVGQVESRPADAATALATGRRLCEGDRDLTDPEELERALIAHNPSREYVRTVTAWYEHLIQPGPDAVEPWEEESAAPSGQAVPWSEEEPMDSPEPVPSESVGEPLAPETEAEVTPDTASAEPASAEGQHVDVRAGRHQGDVLRYDQ